MNYYCKNQQNKNSTVLCELKQCSNCRDKKQQKVYYTSAETEEFVRNAYFDNLITQPKKLKL